MNRTWLASGDYLIAANAAGRTAAEKAMETAEEEVGRYADDFQAFPLTAEAGTALTEFREQWTAYLDEWQGDVQPLVTGSRTALQAARSERLTPAMNDVRAPLTELADLTVKESAEQQVTAHLQSTIATYRIRSVVSAA
ncbi:MAG: MCP four helix bundle domain-containing protein [Actinoplanes sp.]